MILNFKRHDAFFDETMKVSSIFEQTAREVFKYFVVSRKKSISHSKKFLANIQTTISNHNSYNQTIISVICCISGSRKA